MSRRRTPKAAVRLSSRPTDGPLRSSAAARAPLPRHPAQPPSLPSALSLRRQILTAGADTFIKVFDADNLAAEPRTVEYHDAAITSLAIDPKGKHIATGTESHLASYFNFPSCEFDKFLSRAQTPVQHVAFDHKGRMLAVGADDGVIRLVTTNMPQPQVVMLKGHTDSVLCVAYDPKGEYLASSSADGTVRIWDITDEPTTVKTVRITNKVAPGSAQRLRIAWHPSGASLAIPYLNGVQLVERGTWNLETTAIVGGHSKEVSLVAWSRNGQYAWARPAPPCHPLRQQPRAARAATRARARSPPHLSTPHGR